jgi:hypothetical protein
MPWFTRQCSGGCGRELGTLTDDPAVKVMCTSCAPPAAERVHLRHDVRPIRFSPPRDSLVVQQGSAAERRAAGEQDRREWTEGIRRRLGLVAEVHRCWVYRGAGWAWMCLRAGCETSNYGYGSQPRALTKALAHTRSFMPEPPEGEPSGELDWVTCKALADTVEWVPRGE